MNKVYLFFVVAALATAQTPQSAGIVYQQAGVISVQLGADGRVTTMSQGAMAGPGILSPVTGSPLSATQQQHMLQVLGDGTRIEHDESQQFYRDSMGRTRIENGPPGSGTVMIQDPVSKVTMMLDPAARTAQKMPAPFARYGADVRAVYALSGNAAAGGGQAKVAVSTGGPGRGMAIQFADAPGAAGAATVKPTEDDLPSQNVNGVLATGRRTTLTIPPGEIGNDRPIQVVSETWYSSDLKMMVKSSNSDPRFGDSSFELTNINRSEPDPGLFQIPADYTVSEDKSAQFRTVQPKE
jgi:hypothetical protein